MTSLKVTDEITKMTIADIQRRININKNIMRYNLDQNPYQNFSSNGACYQEPKYKISFRNANIRPNIGGAADGTNDTGTSAVLDVDRGFVNLTASGKTVTVATCFDDTTDGDKTACTDDKDTVTNTLAVAE